VTYTMNGATTPVSLTITLDPGSLTANASYAPPPAS
jgi:hypothetical protein